MRCIAAKMQKIRVVPVEGTPNHESIAALAYDHWVRRGRPIGSPEVDWQKAEAELNRT